MFFKAGNPEKSLRSEPIRLESILQSSQTMDFVVFELKELFLSNSNNVGEVV
jgi:hypothetical protein